jgi:hypothetical protein
MLMSNSMHLPRFVVRAVLALRRGLQRAADAIVPPVLPLLERIGGLEVTAALALAGELGIADHLASGPATAADLAHRTGVDADSLGRLMRALVAQGCFRLDGQGRFRNNRLSDALKQGAPQGLRDFARYFGSTHNLNAWGDLARTIGDGKSAFERLHGTSIWESFRKDPRLGTTFAGAMTELTQLEVAFLADAYPFERHRSVCDVGGGRGTLLASILERHPSMRGCLVDGEAALAGAAELFRERGLQERVQLVPADFFGALPSGYDAYLMKDVLHDWDDARASKILLSCRRAMSEGARLLISEMLLDPNEARFPGTLADLQMMMVCSEGRQRSRADMEGLLLSADLQLLKVWKTARFSSWVEAEARPLDPKR